MASLDDGLRAGTAGVSGATGSATGITVAGSGRKTNAATTGTVNAAAAIFATADAGTAFPADATGAAGAASTVTDTVVASTRVGISGSPGAIGTSTDTATIVRTTNTGTARTTVTASEEGYPDKTQASISLPAPKANLAKDLDKTPLYKQRRLVALLHAFLLQYSLDLTKLNDAENKPVVEIINIPKSSTIQVLHSFGVRTNPIGGSYLIAGKIISLVGNGSSTNPPQAMVLPWEVFNKTIF